MRDLDAHSWVEVYFTGHRLGHVRPHARRRRPPTAAGPGRQRPARPTGPSRARRHGGTGAPAPTAAPTRPPPRRGSERRRAAAPPRSLVAARWPPRRRVGVRARAPPAPARPRAGDAAEAGLRELERALPRLGWPLAGRAPRCSSSSAAWARMAGPGAARYVARLREGRFSPARRAAARARAARRALRRELTAARRAARAACAASWRCRPAAAPGLGGSYARPA